MHQRLYDMKTNNSSDKFLPPMRIKPGISDSKSNTLLSELIWHVLLRESLNFCSCIIWFLALDDLVRINRAWLYIYQKPKVWVQQASTRLTQKVQSSLGVIFCYWNFCFCVVKPLMPILALFPISSSLWKTLLMYCSALWT